MSEALYRKYRPQKFSDVTSQDHVRITIQNQLKNGTISHAYMFTGPRGIGKTTFARLIAKAVNCEKAGKSKKPEPCNECTACTEITNGSALDVIEIDAASHTGVDNVRENIIESVRFTPNILKYKVYIIDEVHMLSISAFNALLKTLEEPPAHAIFILATTEIHKVPETIISRCQRFDFKRIEAKEIVARLKKISKAEGVAVSDEVLFEIARHSEGCARDAESLLGQVIALGEKEIGLDEASLVLPAANTLLVVELTEAISQSDAPAAIRLINEYLEQGIDISHFLEDLVGFLRTLLFAKLGGLERYQGEFDKEMQERIQQILDKVSVQMLTEAIDQFLTARRSVRTDKIPQISTELAILKLCTPDQVNFQTKGVGSVRADGKQAQAAGQTQGAKENRESEIGNQEPGEELKSEESVKSEIRISKSEGNPKIEIQNSTVASREFPEPLEPLPPSETIFDSIPVIDIEEVKKKWPDVFAQLQECNASLPLVMQSCEIAGVEGDQVKLAFEYELHVETVNKIKNKQILESIVEKVFGKPLRLEAVHEKSSADEAVSELLNEFGGNVA